MSTIKRALFVAYQFPPAGGIGVHRAVKFTKFLPEFGWETSVLTVSNPSVPLTDNSLLADIPESTEVVRAKTWEPSYAFKEKFGGKRPSQSTSANNNESKSSLVRKMTSAAKRSIRSAVNLTFQPDMQVLWGPNAYRTGCELLRRKPHDVVIATAPPFSSFLVGSKLAKRFRLPLVLDYRDEWGISNTYWENKQQSRLIQKIQQRMQARLLKAADLAIATTPSSCESVAESARQAGAETRCEYIYNGFDPDDFSITPAPRIDYGHGIDRFRLAYVGTLWNLNSIEPLVTAVEQLAKRSPALIEQLEFVVAGRRTSEQENILGRLDQTACRLVRLPFISHSEAISLMQDADCLTLLNSPVPGAERIVNGKIFEYLATRKPFLLISPPGDMWSLTEECPFSLPCDPHHPEQIETRLAEELEKHRLGMKLDRDLWSPERHERRSRTAELAQLLDETCGFQDDNSTIMDNLIQSQLTQRNRAAN